VDGSAFNGMAQGLDAMLKLFVALLLAVPILLAIIAYLLLK